MSLVPSLSLKEKPSPAGVRPFSAVVGFCQSIQSRHCYRTLNAWSRYILRFLKGVLKIDLCKISGVDFVLNSKVAILRV